MDIPNWIVPLIEVGADLGPTQMTTGAAILGGVLKLWTSNNLEQFKTYVNYRWKVLDQTKVSRADLESDYFKSAIIRIGREAVLTASELKREALARSLVNYVVEPTCRSVNKDLIIRILSGLTDTEITVLCCFRKEKDLLMHFRREPDVDPWMLDLALAERIERPANEVRGVCEGLQQSGLLYDAMVGRYDYRRGSWCLTELAKEMLAFALLSEPDQINPR